MSYYEKHLFFCTNQRDNGKKSCQDERAGDFCLYAKRQIRDRGLSGPGGVRVSTSGCLGRCAEGPILVVYPEGIWYTYETDADIDRIIEDHIVGGKPVEDLLL